MSLRIDIGGRQLRPPIDYSVELDMLEPADAFEITMPLDDETSRLARLDAECVIRNGDTAILTGYITDRDTSGDRLMIRGVDNVGRLVKDSVPGAGMLLGNVQMGSAVQRIVDGVFAAVEFSNAANRRLTRGRGRKALALDEAIGEAARLRATPEAQASAEDRALAERWQGDTRTLEQLLQARASLRAEQRRQEQAGERLTAAQARQIPRRIDAGTTKWDALMAILEPLRLIAWSRGDGRALVIAAPQYNQAPQYLFFETFEESNILSIAPRQSIAGRHATIEVSGSGRPPGVPLPPFSPAYPGQTRPKFVSRTRIGVAQDTTGDFLRPSRLFVVSEAMSQEEAQEHAERMMGMGLINADQIDIEVRGHGQARRGTSLETLYTFDTVATVRRDIEAAPGDDTPVRQIDSNYYVTRVGFQTSSQRGDTTRLTMGPIGARIT